MERRRVRGPASRSLLEREPDGVLVLVDLDRLGDGVVERGVLLEASPVDRPDVERWLAVDDPVRDGHPRATTLSDAEAERVAVEEVAQAAFGPEVGIAVGRVGDGAVDDPGDPDVGEHGHAFPGIEDLLLEAIEVGRPQHVGELLGDAVEPHRRRLPFVRPEDVAVAFLAEVVRDVGVAQQRQRCRAFCQFRDLLCHEVLVREADDRQVAPDQRHHFAGAVAGRR